MDYTTLSKYWNRFKKWWDDTSYKETQITDDLTNKTYDLGLAKLLKSWSTNEFSTYYYNAYLLKDGRVFVFIEEYFIEHEETYTETYGNVDAFYSAYFPEKQIVKV